MGSHQAGAVPGEGSLAEEVSGFYRFMDAEQNTNVESRSFCLFRTTEIRLTDSACQHSSATSYVLLVATPGTGSFPKMFMLALTH